MSRSDLLIKLIRSGSHGDMVSFKNAAEKLIADERSKKHHLLADRMSESLKPNGHQPVQNKVQTQSYTDLFFESVPQRRLSDLVLPDFVRTACEELVEEQHRAELLRSHGLEPRHRVLLGGAPGNGKTSLAEAIADSLMVPLITVRYEGLIGSYLGETANRLQKIFDFVSTRRCVLFFDEFDTVGKERGDAHETGEIKRVVSTLLLQVDNLPDYVVTVAASNHPELLDRAVWRRFQIRVDLPNPTRKQVSDYICQFSLRNNMNLGYAPETLAKSLQGASFAEVEDFCSDIQRRAILTQNFEDAKKIVKERLELWRARLKSPSEQGVQNGRSTTNPLPSRKKNTT